MGRGVLIRTVVQLERLTGQPVPSSERLAMQAVLDAFPVRLSRHLAGLVRRSPGVALQFLPDVRELAADQGQPVCFRGLLPTGVPGVERMYPDRLVIMPQAACPAHCRFCFRKFHEHRRGRPMSRAQLDQAIALVARTPELREVLITGGEPLLDPGRLDYLIQGLRRVEHLGPIRVACRALVTDPGLVDDERIALLRRGQDLLRGRPLEVASHVNHPDELTPETGRALVRLREAGLHVYNQAVLLRGCNDDAATMLRLNRALRGFGVELYVLFFAGPVLGTSHLRPTLEEALALKAALRQQGSGRLNPHLIVTTRLGKVELGVDGQVVEREAGVDWVWIRTPYTKEGLRRLHPGFVLPDDARLTPDGRIEVRYLDGPAASGPRCSASP